MQVLVEFWYCIKIKSRVFKCKWGPLSYLVYFTDTLIDV